MYRWDEHTSELELRIEASTQRELFEEAAAALAELVAPEQLDRDDPELESVEVSARAADRPALLAAWLEELLYLAETRSQIPLAVEELELDDGAVRAIVRCARAPARPLVKAVTYHRLALQRSGAGWLGRAVLDV